jgi:hypothetical protein
MRSGNGPARREMTDGWPRNPVLNRCAV